MCNSKNEKIDQLSMLTTKNFIIENQRLIWSLVRIKKKISDTKLEPNRKRIIDFNPQTT